MFVPPLCFFSDCGMMFPSIMASYSQFTRLLQVNVVARDPRRLKATVSIAILSRKAAFSSFYASPGNFISTTSSVSPTYHRGLRVGILPGLFDFNYMCQPTTFQITPSLCNNRRATLNKPFRFETNSTMLASSFLKDSCSHICDESGCSQRTWPS